MSKKRDIISGAERVFEVQGFRGVGVDGILAASGASTRTLYKLFGSREGLVLAVLEERHSEFMARLRERGDPGDPVGNLFDVLEHWINDHGARGCMLLRAFGEYAGVSEAVTVLVRQQKQEFAREIAERIRQAVGNSDDELTTQVWLLFEGATAAASISDILVVRSAKRAAAALLTLADERSR